MKEYLIQLLETFGYPVRLQGSLAENEQYPDTFFAFWNNETYDGSHFDNEAVKYIWDMTVSFYSTSPVLVNTVPLSAIALLKENGWIISGKGYDVPSDEASHTGRAFDALYVEYKDYYE